MYKLWSYGVPLFTFVGFVTLAAVAVTEVSMFWLLLAVPTAITLGLMKGCWLEYEAD